MMPFSIFQRSFYHFYKKKSKGFRVGCESVWLWLNLKETKSHPKSEFQTLNLNRIVTPLHLPFNLLCCLLISSLTLPFNFFFSASMIGGEIKCAIYVGMYLNWSACANVYYIAHKLFQTEICHFMAHNV